MVRLIPLSSSNTEEINRAISKIYDDINEIINAVNRKITTDPQQRFDGKLGDIRVVNNRQDGEYQLQGRTEDGWAKVSINIIED